MFRAHGAAIAGKAGYILCCIVASLVLVTSGFAYYVKAQVISIGGSDVISGGPSVGAMNILLMGLESRTDYDGNVLPADLLAAMHAGSVQGVEFDGVGGQDTNTLILIHIFAGGQKAVGFSIPRDDWVTFPKAYDGQSEGKIDQAYGLAYAQSLNATANSQMSRDQREGERGRDRRAVRRDRAGWQLRERRTRGGRPRHERDPAELQLHVPGFVRQQPGELEFL